MEARNLAPLPGNVDFTVGASLLAQAVDFHRASDDAHCKQREAKSVPQTGQPVPPNGKEAPKRSTWMFVDRIDPIDFLRLFHRIDIGDIDHSLSDRTSAHSSTFSESALISWCGTKGGT